MQKNIGRIVKSGGWLSWATFLQFCNEHLFVAVGALVLGPQTIGMVRASQSLVGLINPFLYALENILPRKIGADMRALGQERAVASYRRFAVAIVFCLGLPLLGIAFFAEPISNLFLGQRVFEVWILQAFCGVYFLIVLRTLITFALRAFECTKAISNATALAALTSAIIAYPAMMFFNVSGLVGGITIAQLIATLALVATGCRFGKRTANYYDYETECMGTGRQGTSLIKVYSYAKNYNRAVELAKKHAVHAVIFKGIPSGSGGCPRRPMVDNANAEQEDAVYYTNFFSVNGKYLNFVSISNDGSIDPNDRTKVGNQYKINVVNVNEEQKNISFVMDSFSEHHATYYGKVKAFHIRPKKDGIFSFVCPETSAQGRLVVFPGARTEVRQPASGQ